MCYYMHKSDQYNMKYYFVPILYDVGCIWVLGAHFDVFKIAYV